MKRRVLAIVMGAALVAGLLVGCGGGNNSSSSAASSAASKSESTAAASSAASTSAASTEASSAPADAPTEITIGVSWQDLSNIYIKNEQEAMIAYAEELGNVNLIHGDGEGDASKQVQQVETFITQQVDVIAVDPYDADGCVAAAEKAAEAGIPYIGFIAHLSDESKLTSYVGSNDVNAGMMITERILEEIGGKGKIAIIEGPPSISAAVQRQEGIDTVLADYPDVEVVFHQPANWDPALAMELMENWIQTGEQIDGVICHNDDMAVGSSRAIANAGLDIPVVGVDAIADAAFAVQDGTMLATAFQDFTTQAHTVVDTAWKIVKGEPYEENNDVPFVLIDASNVDDFIAEQGF